MPPGVRAGLGGTRQPIAGGGGGGRGADRRRGPALRTRIAARLRPSPRGALLLRRTLALSILAAVAVLPLPLTSSGVFPIRSITVRGASLVDPGLITATSEIAAEENLLAAPLRRGEAGVATLPMIATARIRAGIPDAIVIDVVERDLLLRWELRGVTYLIDGDGRIVATADSPAFVPSAASIIAQLPQIVDDRDDVLLEVGDLLPATLFDAVTRLASLAASDFGSTAATLSLRIDPDWGVMLVGTGGASDAAWSAVFGTYTANLRSPAIIPEQIRLLRSLLARGEGRFGWIILADGSAGTYTDRGVVPPPAGGTASPAPMPSAAP